MSWQDHYPEANIKNEETSLPRTRELQNDHDKVEKKEKTENVCTGIFCEMWQTKYAAELQSFNESIKKKKKKAKDRWEYWGIYDGTWTDHGETPQDISNIQPSWVAQTWRPWKIVGLARSAFDQSRREMVRSDEWSIIEGARQVLQACSSWQKRESCPSCQVLEVMSQPDKSTQ